ncbi:unnamed protein product [Malus baccata var. baccata]
MQGLWLTKTLAVREKRVVVTNDLLKGQPTAVVRAEQIAISEGRVRQKLKYMKFLRKRMNTQPSPAKIFWRNVRGTNRGLDIIQ